LADNDVRQLAIKILTSVVRDGRSLSELLPAAQDELDAHESAVLQELTFGVCRSYGRLDVVVGELLKKPLRNKDTDVRVLIWLALYEIGYMRTNPPRVFTSTAGTD